MDKTKSFNRKVCKFGKSVFSDDLSIDDLEEHFNNFIEEVRNKGYIPIKEPKLDDNHYHFCEKGYIHFYEDGSVREADTDEHYFFVRCIYLGKRKAHKRNHLTVRGSKVRFVRSVD